MNSSATYTAEAVNNSDGLADIRIHINGKTWHMWGRKSIEREHALAQQVAEGTLPVLLGSGLGHCLHRLLERGIPVAVVDKEYSITKLTELKASLADKADILWLENNSPEHILDALSAWQEKHESKPLSPVALPLYLRLDRPYYGALADTLKANTHTDFWSQARYPKFQAAQPRVLFFDSSYFLCGEILASLKRLGMDYRSLTLDKSGVGSQTFIEELLRTVIDFKPDFVLTVNHFGLDREGKLAGLLNDLALPLASWFVDNPHLIMHNYAHPGVDNTVIFTYDAGNLAIMRQKGFKNVHYLPLATDPERFKPGLAATAPKAWLTDISFVGNSMTRPVADNVKLTRLPPHILDEYEKISTAFESSGESDVNAFLQNNAPTWSAAMAELPTPESRLAVESLITWEATRQYRLSCVKGIMDAFPLIVGDEGWHSLLGSGDNWRYLTGLDYYEDLPRFYPCSTINFNCTSRQMIGAVNQRVFDVPACGGFVLTDYREQMEDLFDLDTEVAVYTAPDEIPEMVKKFLGAPKIRKKITQAAHKRILAHHTYEIRLTKLVATMRETV